MKISEMLERLGEIQSEHGDIDVVIATPEPSFGDPSHWSLHPRALVVRQLWLDSNRVDYFEYEAGGCTNQTVVEI